MCSHKKLEYAVVSKSKNLVETCGKVPLTSGCTAYGQNLWESDPRSHPQITCEMSAVTCMALEKDEPHDRIKTNIGKTNELYVP